MTYKIEQWVRKIKSQITIITGDKKLHFDSGKKLADYEFDRKYEVINLMAVGSAIEITLAEKKFNEPFNYAGEAALK